MLDLTDDEHRGAEIVERDDHVDVALVSWRIALDLRFLEQEAVEGFVELGTHQS